MTLYQADQVPFLRFIRKPDRQGHVIPPECYVTWPSRVPVTFNFEKRDVVGHAVIQRRGKLLVADMEISSKLNVCRALPLLRLLTPCAGFEIIQAEVHDGAYVILEIKLTDIGLSLNGNVDRKIAALGDLLRIKGAEGFH